MNLTTAEDPREAAHQTFRKWLGDAYDAGAIDAVLATAAAERLSGDPLWLLVISGSGAGKTEIVQSLAGAGAVITSTIASEGALLSGSPKREQTKDASGGLLRRFPDSRGLLVIKDATSILSMNRDTRAAVLAALREIHDGRWERNVGTNGGRTLTWIGRVIVVGAVTTVWDRAHDVIAAMGDRFVSVRMDSTQGREAAARSAMQNTGQEATMRHELADAVGHLIARVMDTCDLQLSDESHSRLFQAANVVTLARTGVEYDYRGDVIDAHAPEMPTRFVKQLLQLVRGAVAIGMDQTAALRLAIRCARDSMPPLRLAIIDDLADYPESLTRDIRKRLGKPRATVDRQLQALHMLGVLDCEESTATERGRDVTLWRYRLQADISPDVLRPDMVPEKSPSTVKGIEEETVAGSQNVATDISGTAWPDEAVR